MPPRLLLYYITDRTAFPGDETSRRRRLLEKISEAARAGVDYIQLREKDLPARDLESLAREALAADHCPPPTALLVNSRTDVALAAQAAGVHLRSDDISPQEVRAVWTKCGAGSVRNFSSPAPLIAVSCHSPTEVTQAAVGGATFAVFSPVFEKKDVAGTHPAGLAALREACNAKIPVLALGGVTLANAPSCLAAGAVGIAAIRLFQENNIAEVCRKLRDR